MNSPDKEHKPVTIVADAARVGEPPQSGSTPISAHSSEEHKLAFSCPVDHEGTAVYVQGWARAQSDYSPVIFVHDLAENVELYEPAAKLLNKSGINAFSFDMRGHGRTSPLAGKMLSFSDLIKDLLQVVAWIRYKSDRKKPILIGQGAGALLLLYFQRTYPQYAKACVILAPVFQEQSALPLLSRLLIQTMALLAPSARLPRFLLPYFLPMSDDVHLRGSNTTLMISARFAQEMLQAVNDADTVFPSIETLNLLVCPVDDSFYNTTRLEELIRRLGQANAFELLELTHISAQALTRDQDELEILMKVLIPWIQKHSA